LARTPRHATGTVAADQTEQVLDSRLVAGVDGCRRGWVAAVGRLDGRGAPSVSVVSSFRELVASVVRGDLVAVAVDIPIGLPDHGSRQCDVEARQRLGPRRSSVFPAPVRAVLGCATWEEANASSRAVDGRGLAHQVFNLLPKIAEVDGLLSPSRQARVVEAHPELCFASIAGEPLLDSKRTVAGQTARVALVGVSPARLPGAAVDDVLDSHAALWTARRVALGHEQRLGDGERDGRGLRMEIVL
jgi:predicted RNase H-like nuclease